MQSSLMPCLNELISAVAVALYSTPPVPRQGEWLRLAELCQKAKADRQDAEARISYHLATELFKRLTNTTSH